MTIPVMHCFDDRYTAPAAVAFLSMLEKGSKDCFYKLYVVHSDISEAHQAMLKEVVSRFENASLDFVCPKNRVDELFELVKGKGHFSKEVLFKLSVADEFPQYDRMLVADVDVIYLDDVAGVFALEMDEETYVIGHNTLSAPVAWLEHFVEECYGSQFSDNDREIVRRGVGGGFLLFNLAAMRKRGVVASMEEFLRENADRIQQSEQDVINFVCAGHLKYLPLRAMVCNYLYRVLNDVERTAWQDALDHPIQLHYALSDKPWTDMSVEKSELWWGKLCETPFYYDIVKRFDTRVRKTNYSFLGLIPFLEVWSKGEVSKVKLLRKFTLKPTIPFWRKAR